jgi:hypothetical protein
MGIDNASTIRPRSLDFFRAALAANLVAPTTCHELLKLARAERFVSSDVSTEKYPVVDAQEVGLSPGNPGERDELRHRNPAQTL